MADTKTNEAKISIKVMVDKVKKRVVYAVADHSFVDILFSFMTMPMGTIVKIMGKLDDRKFEVLESLNNLYQSLKDFPECYFATEECKSMILNPRSLSYDHYRNLKLPIDDTEPIQYYVFNDRMCPVFGGGVFVSDSATFIITDDLFVEPYTLASSVRMLTDFGITDINNLEERNLDMSSHQLLQFLRMSLSIDCPFTYLVFSRIHNSKRESVGSGQHINLDEFDLVEKEVTTSSKMVLKVSMQKSTEKLLFAEANEDFVEFLFSILSIPLGTVIGTLLNGAASVGCMNNIFKSISNMSVGRYLKSQDINDMLLKPHIGQRFPSKHQIFNLSAVPPCLSNHGQEDHRIDGGLLKQCEMFVVTDDLTVTPSSSFSTIDGLRKFKVLPEDIETYEVSVGLKEGLSILEASLRTCSTLTSSLKNQLIKDKFDSFGLTKSFIFPVISFKQCI